MDDYTAHMMNARTEALNATDARIRSLEAGRGDAREIRRLRAKRARDSAKLDALINSNRTFEPMPPGGSGVDIDYDPELIKDIEKGGKKYSMHMDPEAGMYKMREYSIISTTEEEQKEEKEKQANNEYGVNTRCKCGGTMIMEKPIHEYSTVKQHRYEIVTGVSIKQKGVCNRCGCIRRVASPAIELEERLPLEFAKLIFERKDLVAKLIRETKSAKKR